MFNHTLRVHGEKFADAIAIPVNKTETPGAIIRCGEGMSGLEVVVIADTDTKMTVGKTMTVTLQNAGADAVYSDVSSRIVHKVAAGANQFAPGTIITRMTLPADCKPYVKASIGTDDTAPTGTISVILSLLPR